LNRKISLIKKIDCLFGNAAVQLVRLIASPGVKNAGTPESILIIRPGGIGDAVLLIPSLRSIKEKYPDTRIDILAEKRNGEVFSLCPEVNRLFHYDMVKELIAVKLEKYDIVIDTEQWYRFSAVFACLTNAPVRIGFATNKRADLFTEKMPYGMARYEAESFLELLSPLHCNIKFNPEKAFLHIPGHLSKDAGKNLAGMKAKRLISLFPGGSTVEKIWSREKFHQLAGILTKRGYGIILLGGNGDRDACAAIGEGLKDSMNLCGKLTLAQTASILKETSLLITGDSGIMHLACGAGTRTLSLFGPGDEKKWAPRGKAHAIISSEVECRPCALFGHIRKCTNDLKCMKKITVDEVFKKAIDMLERH